MPKSLFIDPNFVRQKGEITFDPIPVNQYDKTIEEEKKKFSTEDFLRIFRDMQLIREFESMFSQMTDASKICLAHLVHLVKKFEYDLIDCQVYSEHLKSLGAKVIPRNDFSDILAKSCGEIHGKSKQSWPSISDYVI